VALTRKDMIEQSLQDWIRSYLITVGLTEGTQYRLEDTYSQVMQSPMDMSIMVVTQGESDPSVDMEIGGPLAQKRHIFHVDVFGSGEKTGKGLARTVEELFESGSRLPLKSYSTGVGVVIDSLRISNAYHARLIYLDPDEWRKYHNVVQVTVIDEFNRPAL